MNVNRLTIYEFREFVSLLRLVANDWKRNFWTTKIRIKDRLIDIHNIKG